MKRIAAILAAFAFIATNLTMDATAGQFGTGFVISPKGYLVTCYHVIDQAESIIVHNSNQSLPAEVVALDPRNDLAILKVEQWEGKFLGLAPAAEVGYASEVIAAGFPDPNVLGKNPKISKGIVNALTGVRDDPRFIQMSAPVQPGNSGGPLISNSGRVVGIVAAGLNSMDRMTQGGYLPQTVNFAVKSDLVFPLLKSASVSLPKFGNRTGNPDKQVSRAIEAIALIEGRQGRATASTSKRSALAPPPPQPSPAIDTFSPQGPWIFPYSHARPLAVEEVEPLNREGLWRARNEIYLRRGLVFSSLEGQQFAREFGAAYRPRTISVPDVQRQFTPLEIANLQLISHFEHQPSR